MKHLKKYNESKEKTVFKNIVNDYEDLFSYVMSDNSEIYTLPFGHYSRIDFNIYIIFGNRGERDDFKFLQDLYTNIDILKQMYNLDFFHIKLTKDEACIILKEYIMDIDYNKNVENYLRDIPASKLKVVLPNNVMEFLKPEFSEFYKGGLGKGINYSNGDSGNLSLFDWVYQRADDHRKEYAKNEDIKIPINVGDTILGGRFKNKKILVKKIGKNKKGDITINDKPLLKFRILKESLIVDDIEERLIFLKEDGYFVRVKNNESIGSNHISIGIFKGKSSEEWREPYVSEMEVINIDDIKSDLIPLLTIYEDSLAHLQLTFNEKAEVGYKTLHLTIDEFNNYESDREVIKVTVVLTIKKKI